MLSLVCSMYDPLGFLAPYVLKAKQILQELCKKRYGWQADIPHAMAKLWQNWFTDMDKLSEFKINRCLKPAGFEKLEAVQLHHFSIM